MSSNVADFVAELRTTEFSAPAKELSKAQRRLAILGLRKVIKRTPVDTGNLRAQWQTATGIAPTGQVKGEDPSGQQALIRGISAIAGVPDFDVIYIVNNAEHAVVVETGGFRPKDPEDSKEANKRRAKSRSRAKRRSIARSLGAAGRPLVAGGFSKQAPSGMLDISFQELTQQESTLAE